MVSKQNTKPKGWADPGESIIGRYPDMGCWLNKVEDGCLNCPFSVCWDDLPKRIKKKLSGASKEKIKQYLLGLGRVG